MVLYFYMLSLNVNLFTGISQSLFADLWFANVISNHRISTETW